MTTKLLLACLFFVLANTMNAQKKTELFDQINTLKMQLDSVKNEAAEARRNEKASLTKMEAYEKQVAELQDANTTLMSNLTTFTTVSAKNSDNFNKAMASLNEKEAQLKLINEAIAKNDSTALMVLTNAKQTLGENANIAVSNGNIIISATLTSMFGSDSGTNLTAEGTQFCQKIAGLLSANPLTALTVEGLSMTGNLTLPAQQAVTVGTALQNLGTAPDRIQTLAKDGNLKEGIIFNIHPKYDEFYGMVRNQVKSK